MSPVPPNLYVKNGPQVTSSPVCASWWHTKLPPPTSNNLIFLLYFSLFLKYLHTNSFCNTIILWHSITDRVGGDENISNTDILLTSFVSKREINFRTTTYKHCRSNQTENSNTSGLTILFVGSKKRSISPSFKFQAASFLFSQSLQHTRPKRTLFPSPFSILWEPPPFFSHLWEYPHTQGGEGVGYTYIQGLFPPFSSEGNWDTNPPPTDGRTNQRPSSRP